MWTDWVLILIVLLLLVIVLRLFFFDSNSKLTRFILEENYKSKEGLNEEFNKFTDRMDLRISALQERNARLESSTSNTLMDFQERMNSTLSVQFQGLQNTMEKRLLLIDNKVNENLEEGFKKTNKTFTNIVARLSKIDEAQKNIDSLSFEIVSLQEVLTDKKSRGVYGEVQLNQILSSIFGDKNDKVYQTQYSFKTGARVDAVLFAPTPLGIVGIDSKFPLENYRKMIDKTLGDKMRDAAERQFIRDCKGHINDIASKYIIPGETSNQAFMFVPAEAVFAYINAYHDDVIAYAQKRNVWLISPTTLMSTLTTVQAILINMQRDKYAAQIHDHLNSLSLEFERYASRWDKLSRNIDTVNNSVKDIHITTGKITKRFEDISSAESTLLDEALD